MFSFSVISELGDYDYDLESSRSNSDRPMSPLRGIISVLSNPAKASRERELVHNNDQADYPPSSSGFRFPWQSPDPYDHSYEYDM